MNRVIITYPARDIVSTGFSLDLAGLCANRLADTSLQIFTSKGTIVCEQRIDLARWATSSGASHIFWIDSDMRFPKDALQRLLAHDKPIVAANYPTRRIPVSSTAKNYIETKDIWQAVDTKPESTGLEEVTGCGMGLMLTDARIFAKLDEPWFTFPWNQEKKMHHGEDIYFCMNAKSKGFPTLIDHDLSKEVRHVGDFEYCHEHVGAVP